MPNDSALMRNSMAWPQSAAGGPTEIVSPRAMRTASAYRSRRVSISETGCSTWMRVFISMKKNSRVLGVEDEFDGARAAIVSHRRSGAGPVVDARALRGQHRRRGLLDQFLVTPLHGAIALSDMHGLPLPSPKTCTSIWRTFDTNRSR